jgi:hypothetical protein
MFKQTEQQPISFYLYGCLLSVLVIFLALQFPFYNWDIVAYVGSVLSVDIKDVATLHSTTYQILQTQLPAEAFNRLLQGNYPQAVYQDAHVFQEQLNFYFIKPLYIGLLYCLSKLGVSIVNGIALVSICATLFCAGLTLHWLCRHINPHAAFAFTLLIGLQSRLFDLARIATPDALSVAVLLAALYILFEKKQLKTASMMVAFAVLVRANNIIFATLLLSFMIGFAVYQKDRASARFSAWLLLITVLSYFAMSKLLHGYSWWTLFYHSFVNKLNHPSQFDVPFSISLYLEVAIQQGKALLIPGLGAPSTLPVFILLLGALCLANLRRGQHSMQAYLWAVCVIILLNYGAYFVLFPGVNQWDRFFTSFYVFSAIMLLVQCTQSTKAKG